jgi:anti-sigma regulatory factor (Ser/Thr protein kinase)
MPPFITTQAPPVSSNTGAADCRTWVLPSAVESVHSARTQVAALLQEWRLPHLVEDATLIVSELVTNAVCHGAGPVWHTVRHIATAVPSMECLRIEVGDHGSSGWSGAATGRTGEADLEFLDCGGRGLLLVEALSSDWGILRLPHGCVVWAVLSGGPQCAGNEIGL